MEDETSFREQVRTWSNFELLDVARHIDRDAYPERDRILREEIARRRRLPPPVVSAPPGRPEPSKYATFWRRFGASLLDGLILLPFAAGAHFLAGRTDDPLLSATPDFLVSLLYYLYAITLHARNGQTIGKMLTRVRVLDLSEEKLSVSQSITRDLAPLSLTIAAFIIVLNVEMPVRAMEFDLEGLIPLLLFASISTFWWLAEILTMATNRKRRAVHDYIAGSVVVRVDAADLPQRPEDGRRARERGVDTA